MTNDDVAITSKPHVNTNSTIAKSKLCPPSKIKYPTTSSRIQTSFVDSSKKNLTSKEPLNQNASKPVHTNLNKNSFLLKPLVKVQKSEPTTTNSKVKNTNDIILPVKNDTLTNSAEKCTIEFDFFESEMTTDDELVNEMSNFVDIDESKSDLISIQHSLIDENHEENRLIDTDITDLLDIDLDINNNKNSDLVLKEYDKSIENQVKNVLNELLSRIDSDFVSKAIQNTIKTENSSKNVKENNEKPATTNSKLIKYKTNLKTTNQTRVLKDVPKESKNILSSVDSRIVTKETRRYENSAKISEKENIFLEQSKSTEEANQLSSNRKRVLGTIPKMISSKKTSSLEKVNNQSTHSLDGFKVNPLDALKTPKLKVQKASLSLLKNYSNKENQQLEMKQNVEQKTSKVKSELENKSNRTTISSSQLSNESKSSIQSGLNEASAIKRNNTQKTTGTTSSTSNIKSSQKQTVSTKKSVELKQNNNNVPRASVKKVPNEPIVCKLERENQLLMQNNECKSKEITYLKTKLKEAHVSFEAILTAYNYLTNELNAFEVTRLRAQLNCTKRTYEQNIVELKHQLGDEHEMNANLRFELAQLKQKFDLDVRSFEKKISELCDEHKRQTDAWHENQALLLSNLKNENEENLERLQEQISTIKNEKEVQIAQLKEQLHDANKANAELGIKIKEFEQKLKSDIEYKRILENRVNLEKEIESLKTALEIKNVEIVGLRKTNNELTSQLENYNELQKRIFVYKQEVENLSEVIKKKEELERKTSETNQILSRKIEMKSKENQRLSMQNEQLQFRLQSQPNLNECSLTTNASFEFIDVDKHHTVNDMSASNPLVKMRSKSMKNPLKSDQPSFGHSTIPNSIRPVSEIMYIDYVNSEKQSTMSSIATNKSNDPSNSMSLNLDDISHLTDEDNSMCNSSSLVYFKQKNDCSMTKSVPCFRIKEKNILESDYVEIEKEDE